jgi:hypothetical protein
LLGQRQRNNAGLSGDNMSEVKSINNTVKRDFWDDCFYLLPSGERTPKWKELYEALSLSKTEWEKRYG